MDPRSGDRPVESAVTSSSSAAATSEGRLGFVDLALEAFAFLLEKGFAVARRDETLLRFESSDVFVNVYHGRSSYQVGLELGRLQEGDLYSLHEVLTAVAPEEVQRARCQTTDREILARCLQAIAEVVEQRCRRLLAGDSIAFEELRSAVAPRRRALTLQAQFGPIMDRADRAWEAKDLRAAMDLYEQATPALDKKRVRRLQFLRERLGRIEPN